jgi:hypothetical protein
MTAPSLAPSASLLPPGRPVLLHIKAAAALRGCSARELIQSVEVGTLGGGMIHWAFDVAVKPSTAARREFRFFAGEIIAPEAAAKLTLGQVIGAILPVAVSGFPIGRLVMEWQLSYAHIYALQGARELPAGSTFPRAALVKFLSERIVK